MSAILSAIRTCDLVGGAVERVLIIKLGALGDFVQALGPMAAIRRHHPKKRDGDLGGASVILLTTKPYVDLARASGLFDDVWVDEDRPKPWQIGRVRRLRDKLKAGRFTHVYDLQTSDRSNFYYHLMGPLKHPLWSGIARGCSHRHTHPDRDRMHTLERQIDQLAVAGIHDVGLADLSFAQKDVYGFGIEKPYALLVAGGAPHRPAKRWPAERYGELANRLFAQGITPVLLGARAEQAILNLIARDAPGTVNLCGKTDFIDIAQLARGAAFAVGNDTGPMHLISLAGCPSIVLYSSESDPALCAQRGARVEIVHKNALQDVSLAEVLDATRRIVPSGP